MALSDFIRENSIPLKPSTLLVSTAIIIILLKICLHSKYFTHNYLLFCKIWSAKRHSCPAITCKCSWKPPAWPLQQCSWSGLPSPDVFSSFLLYLLSIKSSSNLASCFHRKHCPLDFIFILQWYELEILITQGASNYQLTSFTFIR